jgi:hypothetical protein
MRAADERAHARLCTVRGERVREMRALNIFSMNLKL